ncbi:MAG: DUF4115 domain-containing protein [Cyanobacteria bacterium NC_groundwater_1444_Ag_S-0.65um_54_12]|nr:DUF4115 domain-containing protein [Cyanobacteria bacterium NC_groundwater_1444_Ag_S-0.65um_54_12]
MNASLAEIGAELRRARDAQQHTLDELSQMTLIHTRHLLALEEGREADLPEPFYIKNFIRKYANALNLSGDSFATRYWDTRPLRASSPVSKSSEVSVNWWVFPLVIGALLLGAMVSFAVMNLRQTIIPVQSPLPVETIPVSTYTASNASSSMAVTTTSSPGVVIASSLEAGPASLSVASGEEAIPASKRELVAAVKLPKATPLATGMAVPGNLPDLVVPGRRIVFRTQTEDDAWMRIMADGQEVQSGIVPTGSVRTWTASRSMAVRIGRPGVVKAKLGNRNLGSLGDKDAAVFKRTFLTHEGETERHTVLREATKSEPVVDNKLAVSSAASSVATGPPPRTER